MKLDTDLLRDIVLALEEDQNRFYRPPERPVEGHTWEETDAHICMLIELGYIDGCVVRTFGAHRGQHGRPLASTSG